MMLRRDFLATCIALSMSAAVYQCTPDPITPIVTTPPTEEIKTKLLNELNQINKPIEKSPINLNDEYDLVNFKGLNDAKIVGLGEAAIGSKEFIDMKYRLTKYLFDNGAFKTVLMDIDFSEALFLNQYFVNEEANLNGMLKSLNNPLLNNAETANLLNWLKSLKAQGKTFYFYGIAANNTAYSLKQFIAKLSAIDGALAQTMETKLAGYKDLSTKTAYSNDDANKLRPVVEGVYSDIVKNEQSLVQKSSKAQFDLVKQLARVLVQTEFSVWTKFNNPNNNIDDTYKAENINWVLDQIKQTKAVVLSNNECVANFTTNGSGAKHKKFFEQSLGFLLKKKMGTDYAAVGFSFIEGEVKNKTVTQTVSEKPADNSINELFNEGLHKNFYLNLKGIQSTASWYNWLSSPQKMFTIDETYQAGKLNDYFYDLKLMDHYDYIVHFKKVTGVTSL